MTLLALALAATVATNFNLECSGTTYHSKNLLAPRENERPFAITYRIDLDSERYCRNECTVTFPLAQVTEARIVFELEERGKLDDTIVYANRESGSYFDRRRTYVSPDIILIDVASGECTRAPFTGFPERKF